MLNKIESDIPSAIKILDIERFDTQDLLGNLEDLKGWCDLNGNRKTWALINVGTTGKADPVRSAKLLNSRPFVKALFNRFPGHVKHATYSYLPPQKIVHLHRDTFNRYGHPRPKFNIFNTTYRFHIPLLTNDQSFFYSRNKFYHMKLGELWMVNNHRIHGAINNHTTKDRYHLIFDVEPNEDTMKLLSHFDKSLGFTNNVLFDKFKKRLYAKPNIKLLPKSRYRNHDVCTRP